jgi:hypothetical protein
MRALHVGIYTAKGKAVQRGEERQGSGIWLYEFELDGLAVALGQRRRATYTELGTQLAQVGIRGRNGQALSAAALARALPRAITRARRNKRSSRAFTALLFDQLGRRDGRPAAAGDATFDQLQTWILTTDIRSRHRRKRNTGAVAARTAQATPRPCFNGDSRITKIISTGGNLSTGIQAVLLPITLQHLITVGSLIDIRPTTGVAQGGSAHYGHDGPGDVLHFQIGVQFLANLSDFVVRCGPLAGVKWPKKGPIAGVPIAWDSLIVDGAKNLARHGDIIRRDEVTGPDGTATLSFRAKRELVAGIGPLKHDTNHVWPEAHVWEVFGNMFGNVADAAGLFTIPAGINYDISYHGDVDLDLQVRGLKVHDGADGTNHHGGESSKEFTYLVRSRFPVLANAGLTSAGGGELQWNESSHLETGAAYCGDDVVPDHEITQLVATSPGTLDITRLTIAPLPAGQNDPDITLGLRFTRYPTASFTHRHTCGDAYATGPNAEPMWEWELESFFAPIGEPHTDAEGNRIPGTEYGITGWMRGCGIPTQQRLPCDPDVLASREVHRTVDVHGGYESLTYRFELLARPRE